MIYLAFSSLQNASAAANKLYVNVISWRQSQMQHTDEQRRKSLCCMEKWWDVWFCFPVIEHVGIYYCKLLLNTFLVINKFLVWCSVWAQSQPINFATLHISVMFQFVFLSFSVLFWSFVLTCHVSLSISSFFFVIPRPFSVLTCVLSVNQSFACCWCQFSSPEPVPLPPHGMFLVDVSGFILHGFPPPPICALPFLFCAATSCFGIWTFELIWFLVSGCELKACFCLCFAFGSN